MKQKETDVLLQLVKKVIDDLKGTISLQKIIDSLPYDQQQKAIEALPD